MKLLFKRAEGVSRMANQQSPVVRWEPIWSEEDLFRGGAWKIQDGPSKFDLVVSLFHGHSDQQVPVRFVLFNQPGDRYIINVRVTGVSREDGSGESWIVAGYVESIHNYQPKKSVFMNAYFKTTDRKGCATFSL